MAELHRIPCAKPYPLNPVEQIEYPAWVCIDCGRKYGRRQTAHDCTWHPDNCGICGKHAIVTEPRDFGHLRPGWEAEAIQKRRENEKAPRADNHE